MKCPATDLNPELAKHYLKKSDKLNGMDALLKNVLYRTSPWLL